MAVIVFSWREALPRGVIRWTSALCGNDSIVNSDMRCCSCLNCVCRGLSFAIVDEVNRSWHEDQTPYQTQFVARDCTAVRFVLEPYLDAYTHFVFTGFATCFASPALRVDVLIPQAAFNMSWCTPGGYDNIGRCRHGRVRVSIRLFLNHRMFCCFSWVWEYVPPL